MPGGGRGDLDDLYGEADDSCAGMAVNADELRIEFPAGSPSRSAK